MFYVCGGEYYNRATRAYEFKLVHPTNGECYLVMGGLPDVIWTIGQHHSHLYQVNPEAGTVKLVEMSGWAHNVQAPTVVTLDPTDLASIRRRINLYLQG